MIHRLVVSAQLQIKAEEEKTTYVQLFRSNVCFLGSFNYNALQAATNDKFSTFLRTFKTLGGQTKQRSEAGKLEGSGSM